MSSGMEQRITSDSLNSFVVDAQIITSENIGGRHVCYTPIYQYILFYRLNVSFATCIIYYVN